MFTLLAKVNRQVTSPRSRKPLKVQNKFSWILQALAPVESNFVCEGNNVPRHLRFVTFFTFFTIFSSFFLLMYCVWALHYLHILATTPNKAILFTHSKVHSLSFDFVKDQKDFAKDKKDAPNFLFKLNGDLQDPSKKINLKFNNLLFKVASVNGKEQDFAQELINNIPIKQISVLIKGHISITGKKAFFSFKVHSKIDCTFMLEMFTALLRTKQGQGGTIVKAKSTFSLHIFDCIHIPIPFSVGPFELNGEKDTAQTFSFAQNTPIDAVKDWLNGQRLSLIDTQGSKMIFSLAQTLNTEVAVKGNIHFQLPPVAMKIFLDQPWNGTGYSHPLCSLDIHPLAVRVVYKTGFYYPIKTSGTPWKFGVDLFSFESFAKAGSIGSSKHFVFRASTPDPDTAHFYSAFLCRLYNEKMKPYYEPRFREDVLPLSTRLAIEAEGLEQVRLVLSVELPSIASPLVDRYVSLDCITDTNLSLRVDNELIGSFRASVKGLYYPLDVKQSDFGYQSVKFYFVLSSSLFGKASTNEAWGYLQNVKTFMTNPTLKPVSLTVVTKSSTKTAILQNNSLAAGLRTMHSVLFGGTGGGMQALAFSLVPDGILDTPVSLPFPCLSRGQSAAALVEGSLLKSATLKVVNDFGFTRILRILTFKLARMFAFPGSGSIPKQCVISLVCEGDFDFGIVINQLPFMGVKASLVSPLSQLINLSSEEPFELNLALELYNKGDPKAAFSFFSAIETKPSFEFYQHLFGFLRAKDRRFEHVKFHQSIWAGLEAEEGLFPIIATMFIRPVKSPSLTGALAPSLPPPYVVPDEYSTTQSAYIIGQGKNSITLSATVRVPLSDEVIGLSLGSGIVLDIASEKEVVHQPNQHPALRIEVPRANTLFTCADALQSINRGSKGKYAWYSARVTFFNKEPKEMQYIAGSFFKGFALKGQIRAALLGDKGVKNTGIVLNVQTDDIAEDTFNDICSVGQTKMGVSMNQFEVVSIPLRFFVPFRAYFMNVFLQDFTVHIRRKGPTKSEPKEITLVSSECAKLTRATPTQELALRLSNTQAMKILLTGFPKDKDPFVQTFGPDSLVTVTLSNALYAEVEGFKFQIDLCRAPPAWTNSTNEQEGLPCWERSLLMLNAEGEPLIVLRNNRGVPLSKVQSISEVTFGLYKVHSSFQEQLSGITCEEICFEDSSCSSFCSINGMLNAVEKGGPGLYEMTLSTCPKEFRLYFNFEGVLEPKEEPKLKIVLRDRALLVLLLRH